MKLTADRPAMLFPSDSDPFRRGDPGADRIGRTPRTFHCSGQIIVGIGGMTIAGDMSEREKIDAHR
jgi:hypothetical protein